MCCSLLTVTAPAAELSTAEALGKRIYHHGISAAGRIIEVEIIGGVRLPASQHPCVQCHGYNGQGGLEGGVLIPDISWQRLSAPYGVPTRYGGIRPAYTTDTFLHSLREGKASSGDPLDPLMPHYLMHEEDVSNLLAYLQVIDKEDAPGTTDDRIRIASLLPLEGQQSGQGRAVALLLRRYVDRINAGGGIHGRMLELIIKATGDTPAETVAITSALLQEQTGYFCFIANAGLGAYPEVLSLLDRQAVPVIGPLVFAAGVPNRGSVYYLLASLGDQARAAARYLRFVKNPPLAGLALIRGESAGDREMAEGFIQEAGNVGLTIQAEVPWDRQPSRASLLTDLQTAGIASVVFFGHAGQVREFLKQAAAIDWFPDVMTSTVLSGNGPPAQVEMTYITPAVAPGAVGVGTAEFQHLIDLLQDSATTGDEARLLDGANRAMLMTAFAAAKVMTENLNIIGRKLSREAFKDRVNTLRDFDTGVMPPLRYGPNRRVAVRGALIYAGRDSHWISLAD